jgi:hypothetical protein
MIVFVIVLFGIFIRIERHSNAVISDGVGEKLQSTFVQFHYCGIVVRHFPKRLAF